MDGFEMNEFLSSVPFLINYFEVCATAMTIAAMPAVTRATICAPISNVIRTEDSNAPTNDAFLCGKPATASTTVEMGRTKTITRHVAVGRRHVSRDNSSVPTIDAFRWKNCATISTIVEI